jgi:Ca-activated chloride channel family protein
MAAAEAPLSAPMMLLPTTIGTDGGISEQKPVDVGEIIKQAGSKTFILRNDIWTDTSFDSSKMDKVLVEFLSDEYFDLISENPILGDYFALGERVIVVYDGTAYEVAEG